MIGLATLDEAVAANLQHGAMAGSDPLTDSLCAQIETCAVEGAQPALCYADGAVELAPEHAGWWLLAGLLLLGLTGLAIWPWGR